MSLTVITTNQLLTTAAESIWQWQSKLWLGSFPPRLWVDKSIELINDEKSDSNTSWKSVCHWRSQKCFKLQLAWNTYIDQMTVADECITIFALSSMKYNVYNLCHQPCLYSIQVALGSSCLLSFGSVFREMSWGGLLRRVKGGTHPEEAMSSCCLSIQSVGCLVVDVGVDNHGSRQVHQPVRIEEV